MKRQYRLTMPAWAWLTTLAIVIALVAFMAITAARVDALTEAQDAFLKAYAQEAVRTAQTGKTDADDSFIATVANGPQIADFDAGYADVSVAMIQEPLGEFRISYYCACEKCCGAYANGITASGAPCQEGVTCACDVLPIGTMVNVDGQIYTVQDRFGAFDGSKRIDIYVEDHDRAEALGTHTSWVNLVTLGGEEDAEMSFM